MTERPQHHIGCVTGDVAPAILLPGSLERVRVIADLFDESRHVATSREYITYSGRAGDVPLSVTSTGIGSPSASIAVEELVNIGGRLFIRVGTCGAFQSYIEPGDIIIVTGAVRGEGTSREYISLEYPAVADYRVVTALVEACDELGVQPHVGLIRSHDAFYVESPFARGNWRERIQPWVDANVLAVENEAASMFVVSSLRNALAGSILVASGTLGEEREAGEIPSHPEQVELATNAAIRAVQILAAQMPELREYPTAPA